MVIEGKALQLPKQPSPNEVTTCTNEQVKKAFLLSCFVGLRLGDVRELTWAKVMNTPDGNTQYVHVWMEKTQKPINVPLSNEALRYMEKKEDPDAKLFKLPTSDATITATSRNG